MVSLNLDGEHGHHNIFSTLTRSHLYCDHVGVAFGSKHGCFTELLAGLVLFWGENVKSSFSTAFEFGTKHDYLLKSSHINVNPTD